MKPLPHTAQYDDPAWTIQFLQLAHAMVKHGMRPKIIQRYTDLRRQRVTALYKALRDDMPAPGAIYCGEAKFFAIPSRYTSASWVLQGAIFLECFERVTRIASYRINEGWLIVRAFESYLAQTQKLVDGVPGTKRLDINQAYALLVKVSFLNPEFVKDNVLQRQPCTGCGVNFLVVTNEEPDNQFCPVCAINQKAERLVTASTTGANRRSRKLVSDEQCVAAGAA